MNLDTKWEECELAGDPATYKVCEIDTEMGPVRIAAGCVDKMGSVTAATFATNMIHQCRPRLLAMAGICAGVRGKVNIGDAVAADISWDYQSGKETVDGFEPAPHQIPLNSALRRRLLALRDKTELFRKIKGRWPGERPDTEVQFVIGPFASGSTVIADKADLEKPISQHRQMVALDMGGPTVFTPQLQMPIIHRPMFYQSRGYLITLIKVKMIAFGRMQRTSAPKL